MGKRRTVYARTLNELRQKEEQIRKELDFGLNYADGQLTVIELLERYVSLKKGVRYNTKVGYKFVLNLVREDPFGARIVRDIKISDAKRWFLRLHENGKRSITMNVYTHPNYDLAAAQLRNIVDLRDGKFAKQRELG